jgi:CRP-like cAMP-binding protein
MAQGSVVPIRPAKPEISKERPGPPAPFAALAPEEKAMLLAVCTRRSVPRGATVFTQGTLHTTTFIIDKGLVRTYYTSATGKEVTMAYWSDGDLIGGPNFLTSDTLHVWSARAVEDASVWCIAAEDLDELVRSRPLIARFIIDSMTQKIFWLSALLQAFGTQSVFLRLAHLLLKLAEMDGVPTKTGIAIRHHFTQEDLANMVGATRQWVSTTLRHFQNDNIVRCGKGRIEILNVELLRRIAGENRGSVSRS